jgi:hypothetical protein
MPFQIYVISAGPHVEDWRKHTPTGRNAFVRLFLPLFNCAGVWQPMVAGDAGLQPGVTWLHEKYRDACRGESREGGASSVDAM